ncbi:MAG: aspartyl/asparaginyl beta-hydroxylase domain-containing protein [Acidobacteriota bacterium]
MRSGAEPSAVPRIPRGTDALGSTGTAAPQIWYQIQGGRYRGDEPFFYPPEDHPWVATLEAAAPMIREELTQLLDADHKSLQPYFSRAMAFPPGQWKTLGFFFWNLKLHSNCKRCPGITRLLESIPNLTAGSLSVLEPKSNINPHQGDTNAIIRAHLGLSIPAPLPDCGLQVGDEARSWEEGKMLLFCDAHNHTAWNHADRRRLVFIVDVMHPELADRTSEICSHVLADQVLQRLYQRFRWLGAASGRWRYGLHALLRTGIRAVLPIQRRLPWLL